MEQGIAVDLGKIALVCAAITTTTFPLLYSFVPWYRSFLGRCMMAHAVSLAFAIDVTAIFTFFATPASIQVLLWINVAVISAIAITSGLLSFIQARIHLANRKENKDHARIQGL